MKGKQPVRLVQIAREERGKGKRTVTGTTEVRAEDKELFEALRAKRRARADVRAEHLRHRPDIARPFQPREGMDHRFIVDDHRPPRRVGDHHRLDPRGPSDPELVRRPDHRHRRDRRRKATLS